MDKFKEWLYSICHQHDTDPNIVLQQYTKYHPSTIKLSEIVERLKKELNTKEIYYKQFANAIGGYFKKKPNYIDPEQEYWVSLIHIQNNRITSLDFENFNNFSFSLNYILETISWLVQLKIDNTEIINDLEGENG